MALSEIYSRISTVTLKYELEKCEFSVELFVHKSFVTQYNIFRVDSFVFQLCSPLFTTNVKRVFGVF